MLPLPAAISLQATNRAAHDARHQSDAILSRILCPSTHGFDPVFQFVSDLHGFRETLPRQIAVTDGNSRVHSGAKRNKKKSPLYLIHHFE